MFKAKLTRGVRGHPQLRKGATVVSDPVADGVFQDLRTCRALALDGLFGKKIREKFAGKETAAAAAEELPGTDDQPAGDAGDNPEGE